jgi:CO/xanthine dehydrogenase Mo-binding subunit
VTDLNSGDGGGVDVATPPRDKVVYDLVGTSVAKVDGRAKVTGATQYATDFYLRGMLHAKVLFSDRPRARIVSIDTSRAEALPGVAVVVTGDDTPDHRYGHYLADKVILANGEVKYVGEHVAAVAAVTERIAQRAVGLIDVVYEDLPPLLDTDAALADGAPLLHPDVADYGAASPYLRYGNVCMEAELTDGDVDAALAGADVVVAGTYHTAAINHAAIEPHACVAGFDHRGQLTVWTSTQQVSVCHEELAMALGLPHTDVRLKPLGLGGGFGGKLGSNLEPLAALLAQKSGRSVRLVMTREEEFFTAKARAPFTIKVRLGARNDGTLVAGDFDVIADAGGYADEVVGTATHCLTACEGSYHFPALRGRSRAVYTNNPDYGCMRGYGSYQVGFALETILDTLAAELGIDPVELRRMNTLSDGDVLLTTQRIDRVRVQQTMDKALQQSGYWDKKGKMGPNRGIGVANLMLASGGLLSSSALVRLNQDGTVTITTAVVDIGTGTHTALGQIAAEVLDIPFENVAVAAPDSETAPFDLGAIASRTIFDNGSAIRLACEDLLEQVAVRAAEVLECATDVITVRRGRAYQSDDSEGGLDFAAIAGISAYVAGGPLVGRGVWNATIPHNPKIGRGFTEGQSSGFGFGTHVVEVEVDPDTGQTKVLNYTACHDIGRAINPMGAEGQIEGGIAQGLGGGLWEEMIVRDGVIENPNFVDYRLPTMLDTPPIHVSLVEDPDPIGPFGAKGIGEHPILGPAPALANAIADATGVRITEIPVTPERLHSLMHGVAEPI